VLNGSALDADVLKEADISHTDALVALTNDDEVNIIASVIAKKMGCRRTLALLNNSTYPGFVQALGIDTHINPRQVTVSRVLQHVRRGRIRGVHSLQNGAAEVIEAEALETSPLVNRPMRDLRLPDGIRLGAVYRQGKVLMPSGDFVILPKDRVVLFVTANKVRQVEQMFRVSLEFF
jgi:trk system potassium uptake protein